jgi:hypothetical protein
LALIDWWENCQEGVYDEGDIEAGEHGVSCAREDKDCRECCGKYKEC